MRKQQAHRDAPSPSSSGRTMKKRRKKGGSTSPNQKNGTTNWRLFSMICGTENVRICATAIWIAFTIFSMICVRRVGLSVRCGTMEAFSGCNGAPRSAIEHGGSHLCRTGCQEQNDTRVQFSPVPFHRPILPCISQYAHERTVPIFDSKHCAPPAHQTMYQRSPLSLETFH